MKIILLLCISFLLLPTLNAQPIWDQVGFEAGNYTYNRCIDDLNCIGIKTHSAGNAKLIKTTDGGESWEWDPSFTTAEFYERISTVIMLDQNSAAALAMNSWRNIYRFSRFGVSSIVVNEFIPESQFVIYPNPASEYITIQTSEVLETSEVSEIKIFNTLGECVIEFPDVQHLGDVGHLQRIDVSHLPRGVYYVHIGSRTQIFVKI